MENERMAILKMLEDGKITATEASNLLQSVSTTTNNQSTNNQSVNRSQQAPRIQKIETESPSRKFEDFAGDMSKKFETFAKDMEPKLQRFTEVVVEGTANVADKISKSLVSSSTPRSYHTTPTTPVKPQTPPATGYYASPVSSSGERTFELKIDSKDCELNISGLNGNVFLKGYNGDKISGKMYCQAKKSSAPIEFIQLGSKYSLNYNEDDFSIVSIDAYIPEYLFKHISVQTVNGSLSLSTVNADHLSVNNMNGSTEIKDTTCKNLSYESSNGRLSLVNLVADNAKIENYNADTQITGLDVCNLQLETFNGEINMTVPRLEKFLEYTWMVSSSNSGLTMNVPRSSDIGYYVKAHTSLSDIKIALTEMNYISTSKTYVEAKSFSYESAKTKVKFSLETSNAPLILN